MYTKYPTHEMQLLILCTKISLSPEDILIIEELTSKINTRYEILIKLAYRHAVVPQLYYTYKKHFPKYPLTHLLKPYYLNIVQTNMAMSTTLIQLIQLFNAHQIPTLCFKGASLAVQVYGDITLRQYGDLDILIKKEDKEKALYLLLKEDFVPEITLLSKAKKTFLASVNVLGFTSPQKQIFIELHWKLLSKNYAIEWEETHLWNNTQSVYINQQQLLSLSNTNHFLYLCVHGSKHLFERLSWVSDIDHYIHTQNDLDWKNILTQAEKLGVTRMLYLSLYLSHTLLQTPLPDVMKENISQDVMLKKLAKQLIVLHFSHTQQKEKGLHSFNLLWNMRENKSDKFRFVWYALFATKLDDFRFIQLPHYLVFLYPLVRPLRLLIKYLK